MFVESKWKQSNSARVNEALSFIHYLKLMFSIRGALDGMCLRCFKQKDRDQEKIRVMKTLEYTLAHLSSCIEKSGLFMHALLFNRH